MLSMKECLDYCDLNDDEVCLVAHHEHLSYEMAAQLACCMVQNEAGACALRSMLREEIEAAAMTGRNEALQKAELALRHFNSAHPPG